MRRIQKRLGKMAPLALRLHSLSFIRQYPLLFFPLMRLNMLLGRNAGLGVLTRETEVVIEGYFRCANSFATRAFLAAQSRPVVIANRTHAPATVILAARRNLPLLILTRQPMDTVASLLLKHPFKTPERCISEYMQYYRRILPYSGRYVVADFQQVTSDFGTVIARINRRFGTRYTLFEHSDENVKAVLDAIRRNDTLAEGNRVERYSVPVPEKSLMQTELKEKLRADRFKPALERAEAVYQEFATMAQAQYKTKGPSLGSLNGQTHP